MTYALPALLARTPRMLTQLRGPRAQNDNDHPKSPAAAAALRRHVERMTIVTAKSADRHYA